ncbi:TPA: hypothetical protein ACGA34_000283 [Clostridium perfringens]
MNNIIINKINTEENKLIINMRKNALRILNKSIIDIGSNKNQDDSIIFSAMCLQVVIELLIKNYVCRVYGFENILNSKYKKIRKNNIGQYFSELKNFNIKTLGFNELKNFLSEKDDYFAGVINNGKSYLYSLEIQYDYLIGLFNKFQNIRNNFLHLGIDLREEDINWIRDDFYVLIIYFISTIINKNKQVDIFNELRQKDFYITSLDILISNLSNEAQLVLYNDKKFEAELGSIAEDLSNTNEVFKCSKCGKDTLALDIVDSGGQTKCLYCGLCLDAYYCKCVICNDDTIMYDELNMDNNNNVMPGYCYKCERKLKVYKCPVCGKVYSYNFQHPIDFNWECCKGNFVDRNIIGIDY